MLYRKGLYVTIICIYNFSDLKIVRSKKTLWVGGGGEKFYGHALPALLQVKIRFFKLHSHYDSEQEVIPLSYAPETCLRVRVQGAPLVHLELQGSP